MIGSSLKMKSKRVIAGVLAALMTFSVMPVYAEDSSDEGFIAAAADDGIIGVLENDPAAFSVSREVIYIDEGNVTETDSSISISWSGINSETFSHYEVYCGGESVQSGITDAFCTITGLSGGSEYGISVCAYDIDGNIIASSDTLYLYTDWNVTSDIVLTSDKTVSDLYINSGTLDLNGHSLTVRGDVYIGAYGNAAYLNVNKGKLYADGDFNMSRTDGGYGYGYLNMTNSEDYICVNGNFLANSCHSNTNLTDGIIEVKGNFTQKYSYYSDNFAPSKNHKVILSGEGLQTVSFDKAESGFNILEVRNYSEAGVVFATSVTIVSLADNGCNVTFANGERSGWTLEDNETIEGDLFLSRGVLDLNGHKLTVTGNLVHSGGTVLVNGGELEVLGDYRVQLLNGTNYTNSTGVLNMTNEADTVRVLGSFVMQSTVSHQDKLTAGTLEVGRDLLQLDGSYYNFYTSENHTVVLNGTGRQSVNVINNSKNDSRINNLKIANTSSEGVDFARSIYIVGELYNTDSVIVNPTNLYISSTTKFADGEWNNDINFAESYTLFDDISIGGTVYLTAGTLKLDGHKLIVNGDFNMSRTDGNYSYVYLNMTNPEDYICINGDFLVYSNSSNTSLTEGIIEVKGNFTQKYDYYSDNFVPSGNHKVILSGEGLQTVSFDKAESCFNILEIKNYSEEGIVFATPVTIKELIDNGCNVTFANGERSGWTLEDDETVEGDLFLSRGILDLNGHKLTVTGNLVHSGGTVLVNGGELEVLGDYRVQSLNGSVYENSTGVLNMTNEADTVRVLGSFVMQSTASHQDKLTAGTLEIGGDFSQLGGSYYNFYASENHTVVLNGKDKQNVNINNNSKNYSRINNLKIENTSSDGVKFEGSIYVVGDLYNTDSVIVNPTNLYIASTTKFADGEWSNDINFAESCTFSDDLTVNGDIYLTSGTLKLNGHKLIVNGDFNMSRTDKSYGYGYLSMTDSEDYICVNGDFVVHTYFPYSTLTAGIIEVKGNFTQKYSYGYSDNFAPSGDHKVILSGEGLQTVSFDKAESGFNILEIKNYSEEGIVFATSVTIKELIDNGCNVTFANGERSGWTLEDDETIEGDLFLSRGILDLNGHKLTVTGDLVHSGGTVLVNGGELEVLGDYRVQSLNGSKYENSTGVLNMTNEADIVRVFGSFVMQSTASHQDKLTAGTLEVGGDLLQLGGSYYNFYTSGTHTVMLNGKSKQSVNISNNSKNYSRINNLKITNTSSEGIDFARSIYIVGELYNTDSVIVNPTNLYISSTTKFADGEWSNDINFAENYTLSDNLTVNGDVYFTSGTLKPDGHKLVVNGNFNMSRTDGNYGYVYLNMTNPEDYICVNGNFLAYSYYSNTNLTEGIIEVKGDFTQKYSYGYSDNFAPSKNHKVILSGEGLQTVSFDKAESGFNILEVRNYSEAGVVFTTSVTIASLADNGCNVTFANGERSGWTLEDDETIEGDLFLSRGILDLNGHKLTVTGNLVHSGGTVLVNGGELEVLGDYRVQTLNGEKYTNSTGVLNMTNEADTVRVLGSFVMQSTASHQDKLTAGTLEVGGDFSQIGGSYYNFYASGTHTVMLNGKSNQSVNVMSNNKSYSRINNLKITNTSSDGVRFEGSIYVIGELYNTDSVIENPTNLYIASTTKFADGEWSNDINFAESYTLSGDISIGGTVYLTAGTLKLDGHKLIVNGDFNMSRTDGNYSYVYLNMTNPMDYICVNGNFLAYSYHSNTALTAGIIEVKGDFTQKYSYGYSDNFAPSGDHKVILSGKNVQKVNFVSEQSKFNILEITKPLGTGYVFSRTPLWNELIEGKTDTEAPTVPQNLKFIRSNSSSIAIAWNASSDNSAVYCYYIYRDGDQIGSTAKTEYIDNGLSSSTSYEYYVVACDTAGNLSERSNILEAATDVDEYAPTQPKNLSAKILSDGIVRLSWTASSDNGSVEKYNVYRNGVRIGTSTGTAYTDSAAVGGYYEYYVEAVDNEENVSRASELACIDNLAPTAPILTLNSVHENSIFLSWESTDNVKVTKYELYRNGEKYKSLDSSTFVDLSVEDDKTYTYYVVAFDAFSNASEKSNEVTVYTGEDTEAPIITEISSENKIYNNKAVIKVSVQDNVGVSTVTVQCSSDNKNWVDSANEKVNERTFAAVNVAIDTTLFSDGDLYIRAVAEDTGGNKSKESTSPVYKIAVDNTAPEKLEKFSVNTSNNQIELNWSKSNAPDFAHYNLYRSEDNSSYTLISDSLIGVTYTDLSALIGVAYCYAISAVDAVGNESELLYSSVGIVESDSTSPKILSITPADGSKISENQLISIFCMDNTEIKDIEVYLKAINSDYWDNIYSEDINAGSKLVKFNLDGENLSSGKYQMKAVITDKYNNVSSNTIVTYTLEKCELSIPVLSAEAGNLSSELSWMMEKEKNISYYKVYRRRLGEFVYIGKTAEKHYKDDDLEAKKYTYYVVAVDKFGNSVASNRVDVTPLNVDGKAPTAYAGADIVVFENESVLFDGTLSTDNVGVTSYHWNFGDGSSSYSGMTSHSYAKAGVYTASLTVYDAAGNSDTATRNVTVLDRSNLAAELYVVSNSNQPLSNVMVYYELPDGTKSTVYTDGNGKTYIKSGECSVTVYLYKKGYSPMKKTIKVSKESLKHTITLEKQDLVLGEIKVKDLTLQEMIDRGIDITAPENQAVFVVNVQVAYAEDINGNSEIDFAVSSRGDIIPGKIRTESDDFDMVFDTEGGIIYVKSKNDNSGSSATFKPIIGGDEKLAGIAVLRVSQNVTWLKECFDVELSVTNLADEQFPINDALASLYLPGALSLAAADVTQSFKVSMGNIQGGETKNVSWAIMGSKEGEYEISAGFSGTLMPFETEISSMFKSPEKIKVYGSSALKYYQHSRVYTDDGMKINTVFTVTNVSDKSIYNVSANLGDIEELNDVKEMKLMYPDGTIIYVHRDSGINSKPEFLPALRKSDDYGYLELKPGESLVGTHTVSVSKEAMQSAAQSVNNLNLTPDSNKKMCGSIGTVDINYYENSVRAIAAVLAKKVKNGDIRKTTGGKLDAVVVSVAVDISNGKVYWGLNNNNVDKDNNPTFSGKTNRCGFISDRLADIKYKYGYNEEHGVNGKGLINCSEYNAINNAVNCGAVPQNLYVYSVVKKNGDYIPACINCETMYKGYVHFIGDDSDIIDSAA